MISRQIQGDGVDQHLAFVTSSAATWYLTDHLGSTRATINNSGAVQDSLVYDAYGNLTSQSNASAEPLYTYTGREVDVETGLQYSRARWYDPSTGRWITQDPMGFDAGDSNLYRYVFNEATVNTDYSGLQQGGQGQGPGGFPSKNPIFWEYGNGGRGTPQGGQGQGPSIPPPLWPNPNSPPVIGKKAPSEPNYSYVFSEPGNVALSKDVNGGKITVSTGVSATENQSLLPFDMAVLSNLAGIGVQENNLIATASMQLIPLKGKASVQGAISISYNGKDSLKADFLQFFWEEIYFIKAGQKIYIKTPHASGQGQITPSTPEKRVVYFDNGAKAAGYIASGNKGFASRVVTVMIDRPTTDQVRNLYIQGAQKQGAASLTVVQHFTTYLVVDRVVLYRVSWTATATWVAATGAKTGPTYAEIVGQGVPVGLDQTENALLQAKFPNTRLR